MIPAETSVNIYQFSSNGFAFEYVDSEGTPFDLTGFASIKAVLMLGTQRNILTEFDMLVTDTNKVSIDISNEETKELFKGDNNKGYRFEIRFYTDSTNWKPYTVARVNLLSAYKPDGKFSGDMIAIQGTQATKVSMPESGGASSIAIRAKDDAEKHAQQTTQFSDSHNVTFEKGAKGWSEDAESSSQQAQTSESNASSSADSASTSETNAANSATASEQSRQASEGARDESQAARDRSQLWAEQNEDVEVDPGQFSSLHHARKSEGSAEAASNSASSAATSATSASDSATASEQSRQASEGARDESETARDESKGALDEIISLSDYGSITQSATSFTDYGLITQ